MAAAASSLPAWATSTGAVAAGAVVLGAAALYGARQWAAGGKNIHHPALTGKVALITGEPHARDHLARASSRL